MNQDNLLIKRLRQAEFATAAHHWRQLCADEGREVAFAGRSNVGKSSVINRLCGQRSLARTSRTPGRTQQIVFFTLGGDWRIADLPGYGFAKVPEELRRHWGELMDSYFSRRQSLAGLVIIMDVRHPLTQHDQHMLDWGKRSQCPCHIVLNKADKLGHGAAKNTLLKVQRELPADMTVQLFSATKGTGTDELQQRLQQWYSAD
ncbi:MAG: ribosome biogenesis GTP-binding protein YihA/YsxC [Wenzhouxiangellaceae bacterium]